MQAVKAGKFKQNNDDAFDTGIGTQFSAETNKRDEDEEMMKYIEEQLQKKGSADNEKEEEDARKYMSPEDAALYSIPEHLRVSSTHRSEEMLSNQMLSGIPEVDLGIEAKIKNIEATEEAKQKLLQEQKNRKDMPSHFVPTNVAVNFVQHNRCEFTGRFSCSVPESYMYISFSILSQRRRQSQETSRGLAPAEASEQGAEEEGHRRLLLRQIPQGKQKTLKASGASSCRDLIYFYILNPI